MFQNNLNFTPDLDATSLHSVGDNPSISGDFLIMENIDIKNWYYVYIYLDPRKKGNYIYGEYKFDYEPFYVGKGCRSRHTQHLTNNHLSKNKKSPKVHKILKLLSLGQKPIIIKVKENMSNEDAYEFEKNLIKLIGRKDKLTGLLLNLTDGGKDSDLSAQEIRLRINEGKKKTPNFKGKNNPMYGVRRFGKDSPHYGKPHSEETKKFFSELHKGCKPNSGSFKKGNVGWNKGTKGMGLQNAWNKGVKGMFCKEYKFLKDGNEIVINNLQEYCKENGLTYTRMVHLNSHGAAEKPKKPHYTSQNYYKGYSNPNFPPSEKYTK